MPPGEPEQRALSGPAVAAREQLKRLRSQISAGMPSTASHSPPILRTGTDNLSVRTAIVLGTGTDNLSEHMKLKESKNGRAVDNSGAHTPAVGGITTDPQGG